MTEAAERDGPAKEMTVDEAIGETVRSFRVIRRLLKGRRRKARVIASIEQACLAFFALGVATDRRDALTREDVVAKLNATCIAAAPIRVDASSDCDTDSFFDSDSFSESEYGRETNSIDLGFTDSERSSDDTPTQSDVDFVVEGSDVEYEDDVDSVEESEAIFTGDEVEVVRERKGVGEHRASKRRRLKRILLSSDTESDDCEIVRVDDEERPRKKEPARIGAISGRKRRHHERLRTGGNAESEGGEHRSFVHVIDSDSDDLHAPKKTPERNVTLHRAASNADVIVISSDDDAPNASPIHRSASRS
ncbi:hypothetical protein [Psittacid alphaherpesvirus 5]|uniref:Uncharacterized protein n=1 Tax=Psittacid alphaherpesvirus 5 TaxID=2972693 RepID=A0A5P9JP51_9ALPH|nr:hypothetical protein QKU09_gp68 [Psittacid alphaherpesvirus 5]QFU14612.1 hypothetical protein [Psittacid alphaherpesvirus 5]UOO01083.1 hypothetical protein [Psittacid alphaherpesvirus 5]